MSAVPAAYTYYVTARGYLQRYDRVENLDSSIAMFQQAVEQDPRYALAYAGMAEAYWRKHQATKDTTFLKLARTHGLRAIKLNDQLAPVHETMGLIQISGSQFADAVRSFERALELEPLSVDAHRGLARANQGSGSGTMPGSATSVPRPSAARSASSGRRSGPSPKMTSRASILE